MGVDKNTPDPSKLEIFVRDENGEPTGWIKELAWRHFIDNVYDAVGWRPPEELTEDTMKPFFDLMRESGITALFDALIETDRQIRTVYEMDKEGKLHLYYDAAVRFWSYEDLPEKITKLREYQKLYTTEHIKFNTMKLFLDGTNESGNSASLHEPVSYTHLDVYKRQLEDLVKIHRCRKPDLIGDLRDVPVGFKQDTGGFICSDIVDEF